MTIADSQALDLAFRNARTFNTFKPAAVSDETLFEGKAAMAEAAAARNGTLQGAYLIVAARLLGLGCGPMSGFDAAKVNAAFFADRRDKANFLINLGYGDTNCNFPRGPRLGFDEVAQIL